MDRYQASAILSTLGEILLTSILVAIAALPMMLLGIMWLRRRRRAEKRRRRHARRAARKAQSA